MTNLIRVAAAQFATGTDVDANLTTCLRMIDRAAAEGAQLVVLPEFCNHLSIYDDAAHAWSVAVEPHGPWFDAAAERARAHHTWVQINVTLRRTASTSAAPRPRITNSNLVFDPQGQLRAINDKTVLMGAENDYLSTADEPSSLIDAEFGRFGTYACMDGVIPEVPRTVAVRGAQLMLNSLNSFALDEASLHIPVRAAENRVWVVACCKVGPLLPTEKTAAFSEMMGVPADMLNGAGESQIVAPDGTCVAKGPRDGEAVVVADIDLDLAGKLRPDGTDLWAERRPKIYGALGLPTPTLDDHPRAAELVVATASDIDAVRGLAADGVQLVVLPELAVTSATDIDRLVESIGSTSTIVVTSMADDGAHVGIVVGGEGILHRQPQLHRVARHHWVERLGESATSVDLPWGRLAVIVGDDVVYPEVARLAALASVDVIAIPMAAQEPWEIPIGVVERAAENRVITIASTEQNGRSVIADLPIDFTLWAPSRQRTFDGTINQPDVTWSDDRGRAIATVHPDRSTQRQISRNTDLVDNRPWELFAALVTADSTADSTADGAAND